MFLKSEELWNQTIMLSELEENEVDFIDCAGTAWPPKTFPIIPARSKDSRRFFPRDGDGFRAGKIEWDALAISIYLAINENKSDRNQVWAIELGASAAPWVLTFVKHTLALSNACVNTIAIEAGDVKNITQLFWKSNGLKFRNTIRIGKFSFIGDRFTSIFIRGIATNKTGKMYFPKVDISKDNGAAGAKILTQLDRRGKIGFNRVKAIDVLEMVKTYSKVSFLHMDVQGSEVEIMQDPRFGTSFKNVEVLLMGTHSEEADRLAQDIDGKYGFTLIAGNPMKPGGPNGEWPVDGEFLLVSESALNTLIRAGMLTL
jgi:hypothetical protein